MLVRFPFKVFINKAITVCTQAKWPIQLELIPFSIPQHEAIRSNTTPLLDGMPVHGKVILQHFIKLSGFPDSLMVPIYTPGWREAL